MLRAHEEKYSIKIHFPDSQSFVHVDEKVKEQVSRHLSSEIYLNVWVFSHFGIRSIRTEVD